MKQYVKLLLTTWVKSQMNVSWFLVVVFVLSWVLTFVLRRYALAKSLMDIPNERSSHLVPTPRGGGMAIVIAFLFALPFLVELNMLDISVLFGLLGAGFLVAAIGFADDHGHIAARWRLIGHFLAAAWALVWLNGLPPVEFFSLSLNLGWFGNTLALVYLVWMLNLYNFMDGIDGLASVQAVTVCLGMCLVYWGGGVDELIWSPLVLACSVAGFLCWNFPPAKIFMGDAGSGFLGVTLGFFAIEAAHVSFELFWSWIILLGVFIVDATWTLIQRLMLGNKVYEAHRTHAYQHAADYYQQHRVVTLAVVAINVLFLLPIAWLTGTGYLAGPLAVLLAYCPLMVLVWRFKAGKVSAV